MIPIGPEQTSNRDNQSRSRLGVILLTIFLDLVGFSIIFPLFPSILEHYLPRGGDSGILAAFISLMSTLPVVEESNRSFLTHVLFGGVLGSLYSILQFISAPIWGRMSDRIGRRRIMLWTVAGTTFGYLIWILSGNFLLLIISRVINGISGGNLSVATAAVADVTGKKSRSSGMALIGVAFGLGFIVGPVIGGFSALYDVSAHHPGLVGLGVNPFSMPAVIACLLSAINWIWVFLRFEETLHIEPTKVSQKSNSRNRITAIFSIQDRDVRLTTGLYFIFITAFSGMEFTLPFLAAERLNYSTAENARIFLFIGVILIIVQGGVVRSLAPRMGEKCLAIFGILSGILAFFLIASALSTTIFYLGLALLAIGIGLASPTLASLVSLYSSDREQGHYLGLFRSAGSLARAIGPIAAGLIYWYVGSRFCYLTAAVILFIPLTLASRLRQPAKN